MNLEKIGEIICKVAEAENTLLLDIHNEGIFFMPELAFAYECGKHIMQKKEICFPQKSVKWLREYNLGNGGPTDLVFEIGLGEKLAIEFKKSNTDLSYAEDIKKLSDIDDSKCRKVFCALIDVFDHALPDDGRQRNIEELEQYNIITISKHTFRTKWTKYKSNLNCVVCVWSIG